MQLEILTPDKTLFSGEVISVTVPGSKGKFQILNGHAALVSSLDKGKINIQTKNGNEHFEISGGVVEVLKNKVVILA
ncbi:MAG: ATP synthase F1 subunit epsilon [Bacteroidota bacterium]|jgi:F-type H+-transporting ATPase subunit epsilon